MARTPRNSLLARLLLFTTLILLIGIAPYFFRILQEARLAREAHEAGNYIKASMHMANLAERLPWRSGLWEQAAHYALLGGDTNSAISYLERVQGESQGLQENEAFDGLTLDGWIDLGDAYQKEGDLTMAIQTWQEALNFDNNSIPLHHRLWEAYISLEDYPSALTELQVLTSLQPENADYLYHLGLLQAALIPEAALEPLQKAADLDASLVSSANIVRGNILAASLEDDPAYTLMMAGRSLAVLKRWDLAAEAFRQSLQVNPEYAEAWAFLGEALQHLAIVDSTQSGPSQDSGDGYDEIRKALSLDPKSLAAHIIMGLYWTRQENYELAEESIRNAIELYPEEAILQVELGNILASAGRLGEAYDAYNKAILLQPENASYQRHLADFSLSYNYQVEDFALPAARKAIVLAPNDAQNLDLMAQVLIRLGDLANAERFLWRALELDPTYAPAHLHLGMIFLLLGETTNAVDEFNQVNTLAPNSPAAEQARRLMENYLR